MWNPFKKINLNQKKVKNFTEEIFIGTMKFQSYDVFWGIHGEETLPLYELVKNGKVVKVYAKKSGRSVYYFNVDIYENIRKFVKD